MQSKVSNAEKQQQEAKRASRSRAAVKTVSQASLLAQSSSLFAGAVEVVVGAFATATAFATTCCDFAALHALHASFRMKFALLACCETDAAAAMVVVFASACCFFFSSLHVVVVVSSNKQGPQDNFKFAVHRRIVAQ